MALKEFTRTVGKHIGPLGGGYMLDPATGAFGEPLGLDFFGFYALGRGGVLGNVDGDVVASTFFFFEPNLVKGIWDGAREKVDPAKAVEQYAEACRAWGRARFENIEGLDDFCKLAQRVVEDADPEGLPLFTGWRPVALPDDAPGRATQLIHVLRELRGGAHVNAVRSAGITPHEAISVNTPHMCQLFGWGDPIADVEPLRERLERAEDATDERVGPAFAVLDEGERETFASVVERAAGAAGIT